MTDLSVSVQVLDANTQSLVLDLSKANGYRIVSLGEGGRSFRRITADSPWVPGRALVGAVLDVQTSSLVVRCTSTTQSGMRTLVNNARTALGSLSYILAVTLGGVEEKWLCEAADSTLGDSTGVYDKVLLMHMEQILYFTIPRSPILV